MVYDTISVKQVIAKVLTDNNLHEENHRIADMIEWAGEALEKIGAFPQLEIRVAGKGGEPFLRINNYQAKLPKGLHSIIQAVYKPSEDSAGYLYPMRYSSGSFEAVPEMTSYQPILESAYWNYIDTFPIVAGTMMIYNDQLQIHRIDNQGETRNLDEVSAGQYLRLFDGVDAEHWYKIIGTGNTASIYIFDLEEIKIEGSFIPGDPVEATLFIDSTRNEYFMETSRTMEYVYVVQGGYFKTNVRDGFVMLSYTRIPIDNDGYPKVPNNMSYIDALYWYITMKLNYPKWVKGELRDGVYFEMRRSWNYYRKQAYGEALMPEGDQLHAIKNTWNQLIPELNAEDSFYSGVGEQETIYNQNTRTWPLLYNRSTRG